MTSPQRPAPWTPPDPPPDGERTDRLVLRFYQPDEGPKLFAAVEANREHLLPWLPWARTQNQSVEQCTYVVERFRVGRETRDPVCTDFTIAMIDGETDEVVGGTGFHRIDRGTHQAEIGYWVRGDRAGRGLCTEATRAMIGWGLRPQSEGGWGFRRIVIYCAGGNAASRRVLEKLGLNRESHTVRDRWVDGIGWEDTLGWGVDVGSWEPGASRTGDTVNKAN